MILAMDRSNLHIGIFVDPQELKDLLAGRVASIRADQGELGWQVELICPLIDPRAAMFRQGEGGRFDGHIPAEPLRG